MKNIIFLLIILTSCTKEVIQKECGNVTFITERYDLDKKLIGSQIDWQGERCGELFQNAKIQEPRDTILTAHCMNGETLWFEKHIVKTD